MSLVRMMTDLFFWEAFFFLEEGSDERQEVEQVLEKLQPFMHYGLVQLVITEESFDDVCLHFCLGFQEAVDSLGNMLEVIRVSDRHRQEAQQMGWADFDAALTYQCAQDSGIAQLITPHPERYAANDDRPIVYSLREILEALGITSPCKLNNYVSIINRWVKLHQNKVVCTVNTNILMEAYQNPYLANVLPRIDLITPSGQPIAVILKLLGISQQERVTGTDLLRALSTKGDRDRWRVFLVGSQSPILETVTQKLQVEFPNLVIAGCHCLKNLETNASEQTEVANKIDKAQADLVFVSLPHPRQEIWLSEVGSTINSVVVGVGRAFPIYADLIQEAPLWLQRAALEWLWMWLQSPRELWAENSKIPQFLWLALKNQIFQPGRRHFPIALPQSTRIQIILGRINTPKVFA